VGYQAWLKSSGLGASLDAYGADDGKREQGSYMANRCCDAARWLLCLPKPTGDDDDANDHTSEARERRKRRRDAAAASNRDGNSTATPAASHEPLLPRRDGRGAHRRLFPARFTPFTNLSRDAVFVRRHV